MMSIISKSSPLSYSCGTSETKSSQPTNTQSSTSHPHQHSQHHHHHQRRMRQNSLSSSANDGSSDNLSGYASSFESTSSFSDDFLSYQPVNEGIVEVFYEERRCEMVIDENLRSSDLCHLLTVKLCLNQSQIYALILQLIDANLERVLQDDEEVLPQYNAHLSKFKCKLTLKINHFHYDFIQNPTNCFPLDMISFGAKDYQASNRIKIANLQDQLTSADSLNITVSGPLQYHKQVTDDRIESKKIVAQINCVDEEFVCNDVDYGRKTIFNVHRHSVFYPILDSECKLQLKANGSFVFALINDEDRGIHWFSATTEKQRQCWSVAFCITKYGLTNLRNSYLRMRRETLENVSPSSSYLNMNQRNAQDMNIDLFQQFSIEQVKDSRKKLNEKSASQDKRIDRSMQHVSQPWFYPEMSRKEANECLQKYAVVDGVFLVRSSQRNPGSFVLSFVSREKVNHVPILVTEEIGQISLSLHCGRTRFYDLKQLVEFYQLNTGCLPTKLTHFLVHR